jgi:hypothetical protein
MEYRPIARNLNSMLQSCRLFQLRIDWRSMLQLLGLKLYCATPISRSFDKIFGCCR